jgi:acyl dehydratase
VAAKAGFDRPILHGLCTMAVAARSVLSRCCSDDPSRLKSLRVRFSAPVFPGETLATDIWLAGQTAFFRTRCVERDIVAISGGFAEFT